MYPLRQLFLCFGGDGRGYGNGDGSVPPSPLTSDLGGAQPVQFRELPGDVVVQPPGGWPWRAAQSGATGSILTCTLCNSQRPDKAPFHRTPAAGHQAHTAVVTLL